ncbi:MAG: hypothetical protein EPN85_08905 [Bacteroidetes bacterium]|nr:MAG: hypothetical protein EPN85_08905 [Bacteroidota bacterium]
MSKKYILLLSTLVVMALAVIHSCKKEPVPHNPYDDINYGTTTPPTPPDPNSIVGIQTNILKTRCAKSGCHDGNFEPDFRTVESSYATLVYHRIKKNSIDSTYTFRVVPYDTAKSNLIARLTRCNYASTSGCDRMPQDIIGVPLEQNLINNIVNWIKAGTKDMFGTVPSYPNTAPKILYYYATDPTYSLNYGADTNRMDSLFYNPFYVPNNKTLVLAFLVDDDSTSVANMQVNQLKISTKMDDFSSALSYTATYLYVNPTTEFHLVNINTATLPNSDTLFMRYFVNDGDHPTDTQFPTDNLVFQYKTFYSFFVKP